MRPETEGNQCWLVWQQEDERRFVPGLEVTRACGTASGLPDSKQEILEMPSPTATWLQSQSRHIPLVDTVNETEMKGDSDLWWSPNRTTVPTDVSTNYDDLESIFQEEGPMEENNQEPWGLKLVSVK